MCCCRSRDCPLACGSSSSSSLAWASRCLLAWWRSLSFGTCVAPSAVESTIRLTSVCCHVSVCYSKRRKRAPVDFDTENNYKGHSTLGVSRMDSVSDMLNSDARPTYEQIDRRRRSSAAAPLPSVLVDGSAKVRSLRGPHCGHTHSHLTTPRVVFVLWCLQPVQAQRFRPKAPPQVPRAVRNNNLMSSALMGSMPNAGQFGGAPAGGGGGGDGGGFSGSDRDLANGMAPSPPDLSPMSPLQVKRRKQSKLGDLQLASFSSAADLDFGLPAGSGFNHAAGLSREASFRVQSPVEPPTPPSSGPAVARARHDF